MTPLCSYFEHTPSRKASGRGPAFKPGFALRVYSSKSAGETPRRARWPLILPRIVTTQYTVYFHRCVSTVPRPLSGCCIVGARRCIERNFTASRSEMFVLTRPSSHNAAFLLHSRSSLSSRGETTFLFPPTLFRVHVSRASRLLHRERRARSTHANNGEKIHRFDEQQSSVNPRVCLLD